MSNKDRSSILHDLHNKAEQDFSNDRNYDPPKGFNTSMLFGSCQDTAEKAEELEAYNSGWRNARKQ